MKQLTKQKLVKGFFCLFVWIPRIPGSMANTSKNTRSKRLLFQGLTSRFYTETQFVYFDACCPFSETIQDIVQNRWPDWSIPIIYNLLENTHKYIPPRSYLLSEKNCNKTNLSAPVFAIYSGHRISLLNKGERQWP